MTHAVLTSNRTEAEHLLIQLDEAQSELQEARTEEAFNECKAVIAALTSEIEARGFLVERCVTGWRLVEVESVAHTVAANPTKPATTNKKSVTITARYVVKQSHSVVYLLRNGRDRMYQVCLHADGTCSCTDDAGETCKAHQYGHRNCYHVTACRAHEEVRHPVAA